MKVGGSSIRRATYKEVRRFKTTQKLRRFIKENDPSGFTLIELLVAVAIVGILVNMAMPIMDVFKVKAGRVEAFTNLSAIYALQKSYHADHGTYGYVPPYGPYVFEFDRCEYGDNDIGFKTSDPCKLRHVYSSQPVRDYFNRPFALDDNKALFFTGSARTYYDHVDMFSHTYKGGKGYGISTSRCRSPLLGLQGGYHDYLVINQDAERGHFYEGYYRKNNATDSLVYNDILKQCG